MEETTDASGRYVGGALRTNEAGTPILLNTDVHEKVNHTTLTRLFTTSLELL